MRKDTIVYQPAVEDIHTFVVEYLERKLSNSELKKIINRVGDYIPWYDANENSIIEFGFQSLNEDDE